uniref:Trafficking protein particle complex subunit 13 n=1 Tax=Timema shepardi TaxID=629360 RepID=A0A7R9FZJ5_TIMSH|nr:unnamed protein product [Timema shepardi]
MVNKRENALEASLILLDKIPVVLDKLSILVAKIVRSEKEFKRAWLMKELTGALAVGVFQADLQTSSQRIPLSNNGAAPELRQQETLDDVIHHEVKEVGTHILVCEVSYLTLTNTRQSFRKFFKFQVLKPLDVKTKFYNAESDEVYLEAQVQNITNGPISLEKVSLESSHLFTVTSLNNVAGGEENESVFGQVNVVQPQSSRQFLYCLAPQPSLTSDLKLLSGATNIGKLDIVWRSNLGERGRLQTSQLQRMAPDYGDIRLSVQQLPNIVFLDEAFSLTCKIINTCERSMELIVSLEPGTGPYVGLVWSGVSGRHLGKLEPRDSLELPLCLVPLAAGLQVGSTSTNCVNYSEIPHRERGD